MSEGVEVKAHVSVKSGLGDFVEMILESVHESAFCLTHILLFTSLASDAVDDVGTLARYIVFTRVCSLGD